MKPTPSAKKMIGHSAEVAESPPGGLVTDPATTARTGVSRTRKSKIGWPTAAITNASRGKFILVTIEPAVDRLAVQAARHPAKSCQTLMPHAA